MQRMKWREDLDLILSEQNKGKLTVSDHEWEVIKEILIFEAAGYTTLLGSYRFIITPPKECLLVVFKPLVVGHC